MELAEDIYIALSSIGVTGASSAADIKRYCDEGIESADYRYIIVALCEQLKKFLNLEESIRNSEDIYSFGLELAGFLRELNCPNESLISADREDRFLDCGNCLELLDYLISELQAIRLIAKNQPDFLKKRINSAPSYKQSPEGVHAYWLQQLCKGLGFPKPPANIREQELCSKIYSRVTEVIGSWPPELLGKPLVNHSISPKQWKSLVSLNEVFSEEYAIRREMLLTRLDVTIRSFGWGDKNKSQEIEKVYLPLRQTMKIRTGLGVASILAARDDLIRIRKTCDASLRERTRCDLVNKAKMGAVPDRGGRANEYDAPPPEMPFWQKRQSDSGHRGGGGGGRGGRGEKSHNGNVFDRLDGGGGRPQKASNHQQSQQFRPQSNFDQFGGTGGGNDYQGNRGYSGRGRGGHRGQRY